MAGTWLLGRRYGFSPRTLFFVTAAATGSCLWTDQIFFNLRLIAAVPLVLWLMHGFLDSGSRGKFYLAGNLLLLQFTVNLSYLAVFTLFVVVLYLLTWIAIFGVPLRRFRPCAADGLGVVATLLTAAAVYVSLSRGAEAIAGHIPARNADATASLDVYLTYPGELAPAKFLDVLFGVSGGPDVMVYAGMLTLGFAFLAPFLRPGKPVLHLAICLILGVHLTVGYLSVVPVVAYYFPAMNYYRHLGLAVPFARLVLILLAGHGLEAVLADPGRKAWLLRAAFLLFFGVSVGLAVTALTGGLDRDSLPGARAFVGKPSIAAQLFPSSVAALAAGIVMMILSGRRRAAPVLVGTILLVQAADTFGWKFRMAWMKTVSLDDRQMELQRLGRMNYSPSRSNGYEGSERYGALADGMFTYGWVHGVCNAYFQVDPHKSRFKLDYWMRPVDELRIAAGEHRELGMDVSLDFSRSRPAIRRVIGAEGDKIQLFSRARSAGSADQVSGWIADPEYQGTGLFVLDAGAAT